MINCKRLSVIMNCVVGSKILREADHGDGIATIHHKQTTDNVYHLRFVTVGDGKLHSILKMVS